MAVVFSDGFDSYAATADLVKKWASAASFTWNATAGRTGGGAAVVTTGAGALVCNPILSTSNVLCFAFWVKISAVPAALTPIIAAYNSSQSAHTSIRITTAGLFTFVNTGGSQLLTGTRNFCDNVWHWVEWYLNIASPFQQTCYVDGLPQWSGAQASVGAGTNDHFALQGANSLTITFDDVFVFDDSTGAPQGSAFPLGPREIQTLRPNGDSAVQFTPNTGATNYTQINEVNADGDTSYVEDGNSGDQDLYTYGDISGVPGSITAAVVNSYLETPFSGVINFQQICKSVSTQLNGTSTPAPAAYRVMQQQFGTDPNTGSAWSLSGLNAATFGIKVV